ncbi:FAD-dependent oxidoreductase [Zunongwangia sp. F363]|uniref:FAD-dependent oxidoreductase n=1 Tax=Autumnicola tepida TaxID=3075595 RepID=A0ABU3C4R1_9FLAO|nr:FAD-dependent oxidoreductase [Zunongwangia sp. F363]MDT0641313.1 FAD-dependent oxidoreductase [Zunongwangia sp. F363]
MVDYIVVGLGLSGLAVISRLEQRKKSFLVYEDNSQHSSQVAGGIFNPVILKRFTLAWKADEQIKEAIPFYQKFEKKYNRQFLHFWEIYRRFHSAEEQNNWFNAADKPGLDEFLNTELVRQVNANIPSSFSFGRVKKTGNINTDALLKDYRKDLLGSGKLIAERFDYDQLEISGEFFRYKDQKAKRIIFCEGFGMTKNPFFNYLPLRGNKGEYIIIRSEALQLNKAVKSSVFLMPLGNNLYKVGATYNHKDKTPGPTQEARGKLATELNKLIECEYEVVDQVAGIRPATADRRALIGSHPEIPNMYCCNGFGSRGVLIAPMASRELVDFIEEGAEISPEIDLQRFTRKHYRRN